MQVQKVSDWDCMFYVDILLKCHPKTRYMRVNGPIRTPVSSRQLNYFNNNYFRVTVKCSCGLENTSHNLGSKDHTKANILSFSHGPIWAILRWHGSRCTPDINYSTFIWWQKYRRVFLVEVSSYFYKSVNGSCWTWATCRRPHSWCLDLGEQQLVAFLKWWPKLCFTKSLFIFFCLYNLLAKKKNRRSFPFFWAKNHFWQKIACAIILGRWRYEARRWFRAFFTSWWVFFHLFNEHFIVADCTCRQHSVRKLGFTVWSVRRPDHHQIINDLTRRTGYRVDGQTDWEVWIHPNTSVRQRTKT